MANDVQTQSQGMEVTIHTQSGDVKLTPAIVRKYLVNGNGAVTDQEVALFLGLCRAQQLNPFTRECYLVKYPGDQPAAVIVAKETFLKRAYRTPNFKGHKAGIIVQTPEKHLEYTVGICPPGSKLVGGWAEVHISQWDFPLRVEVDYEEYVGKKKDGMPNRMWASKPATMIRKVALVQALREAFPDNYQGMYSEEEISTEQELPTQPVEATVIDVGVNKESPKEETKSDPEKRRRRYKYAVDPEIFGTHEIMTCGASAEQLTELYKIASTPAMKEWITASVYTITGYDKWTFLRDDEAMKILAEAKSRIAEEPVNKIPEPIVQPTPTDLVDCPMRPGDKMSVSTYCKTHCADRKTQKWCPAVPGDEPVQDGVEML